jgi:hypothetical protein
MRASNKNNTGITINEHELLEQLLHRSANTPGNQIWAIYGAPGSGKSELMRWLEIQIRAKDTKRTAGMIRITRNELDIFSILKRFENLLPTSFFQDTWQRRWEQARQKPRTLSKLLLLHALESSCDSDKIINDLFYRLVNVIYPHIEHLVTPTTREISTQDMEIISIEAWNAILQETAIPITLDYEQFRHRLMAAFTQHLLSGLSLSETLKTLSYTLQQDQGIRPILLIDDLVQSLNLFATDILDYFLDLEKGTWDVIIGLTPAAFEDSQRGRHLLERLTYLDTIDDRIEKLWLSDEEGTTSFVLTEENCYDFAELYLAEYYKLSGKTLKAIHVPLNKEVLIRIFRGLPQGKGKIRYFLRHLRLILEANLQTRSVLPVIEQIAKTEFIAYHEERALASFCELYGPLLTDKTQTEITLTRDQLHLIGNRKSNITFPIEPIIQVTEIDNKQYSLLIEDEEKAALRDWMLGRGANRQLFHTVRQGIARLLRTVGITSTIHAAYIAAPSGLLQWHHTYLDVHPPICFEGVDQEDGILISPTLEFLTFDLYRYAHSSGHEAKELETKLLNQAAIQYIILQAEDFHHKKVRELENQLGTSLDYCALSLCIWSLLIQLQPAPLINLLPPSLQANITQRTVPYLLYQEEKQLSQYIKDWQHFFDDFFQLRERFYDIPHLMELCQNASMKDILNSIVHIDPTKIHNDHRWGKKELSLTIEEWQRFIQQIVSCDLHSGLPPSLQAWLQQLEQAGTEGIPLKHIPEDVLLTFLHSRDDLASRFHIYLQAANKVTQRIDNCNLKQ